MVLAEGKASLLLSHILIILILILILILIFLPPKLRHATPPAVFVADP